MDIVKALMFTRNNSGSRQFSFIILELLELYILNGRDIFYINVGYIFLFILKRKWYMRERFYLLQLKYIYIFYEEAYPKIN